jgi:hypothetical protein
VWYLERDWSFTLLELASDKTLLNAVGRLEAPVNGRQHDVKMRMQKQVMSTSNPLSVAMVWSLVTKFNSWTT